MKIEIIEKICKACNKRRVTKYNDSIEICLECSKDNTHGVEILLAFVENVAQLPHWLADNAKSTLVKYKDVRGPYDR